MRDLSIFKVPPLIAAKRLVKKGAPQVKDRGLQNVLPGEGHHTQ